MPITNEDQANIDINSKRIQDPAFRMELFKQFVPTFHYTQSEVNFPGNFEEYVQNVIEVKHEEYTRIKQRHERDLTFLEQLELDAINNYFWKDDQFNPDYKKHQNDPRFRALTDPILFIQSIAEYKYRKYTERSKELNAQESAELALITKHCVIANKFQWVGEMQCGVIYISEVPSEHDLKQYADSQYIVTDTGLYYFKKIDGTLIHIELTPESFSEFKAAFKETKHILSDDDFRLIKSIAKHSHDKYKNTPDELKVLSKIKKSQFLIFDEKHYGYNLGEKIDVVGVAPIGHPNYDSLKPQAELPASIVPTAKGYYIQYDYFYPLNGAIPGLQWLRNWSPESFSNLVDNFGLHYGDCEGVGIHVIVDDEGKATFDFMQTFAHGAKGSRIIYASDCTFDQDGQPCVFVGEGPHPSYADNFIGRSKYLDRVDDAYKIKPNNFIDVSAEVISVAIELTNSSNQELPTNNPTVDVDSNPKIKELAEQLPPSIAAFKRWAESCPLAHCGAKNAAEVAELIERRDNYKPSLVLTKTWHSFRKSVQGEHINAIDIPVNKNIVEIKKYVDTISTLFSSTEEKKIATHMIARLSTTDAKAKQFFKAMQQVEMTCSQIEKNFESNEQFNAVKDSYRKALYQTIFKTIEKNVRPSKKVCLNNLNAINDQHLECLTKENHPWLRTLVMAMTNALTLLFTAGVANVVNKYSSGRFLFFDRPESKGLIDDMSCRIASNVCY